MKIARSWLEDYIDLGGLSDEDLSSQLTAIGHAVESVERHGDEAVFEIEFTSNRLDAMSHRGLARELAAATGRTMTPLSFDAGVPAIRSEAVSIRLDAADLAPRFSAQILRDVKIGESSARIRHRLEAVGLRPINNAADVTNYVMLALGHPMHAFDLDAIGGRSIVVRRAAAGEKLVTLDGVERKLDTETVVIADAEKPLSIGGVLGGGESEITESTTSILLECAWFQPSAIRRTAKKQAIHTDAAYRFERGVDPEDTLVALEYATRLILEECGGTRGELLDVVAPGSRAARTITLTDAKLAEQSGGQIAAGYALALFRNLGMDAQRSGEATIVSIPSWRGDLHEEMDLVEEAIRFFGFNNIRSELPRVTTGDIHRDELGDAEERARDILVSCGLTEVVTYSFISEAENTLVTSAPPLTLSNALTENISSMRLSLVPGLLSVAAHNRGYGTRDAAIFEVGRRYESADSLVRERRTVAILMTGNVGRSWNDEKRASDFYDLKGVVERLARGWHVSLEFAEIECEWLRKGQRAGAFRNGSKVATLGAVSSELLQKAGLKGDVFVCELDLEALADSPSRWEMDPVSKFPGVPMVLAFHHPPSLEFRAVERAIEELRIPHLRRIGVWDRFVAPGSNEVKTAVGLFYQSDERSLTQEEVLEANTRLARALSQTLPVKLIET